MRFAFGSVADAKFEIVKDVLECPDPFELGIVFLVLRPGSGQHMKRVRRRMKNDPVLRLTMSKYIGKMRAKPEPPPEKVVGPVHTTVVDGTVEAVIDVGAQVTAPEPPDPWLGSWEEAIAQLDASGQLDWFELTSADRQVEAVVDMLVGWSGVQRSGENGSETMVDVEFTPEVATELFRSEEYVVRAGLPYAGQPVGAALVQHVTKFAKNHAEARQKYLEDAAKNSEPSSAGA